MCEIKRQFIWKSELTPSYLYNVQNLSSFSHRVLASPCSVLAGQTQTKPVLKTKCLKWLGCLRFHVGRMQESLKRGLFRELIIVSERKLRHRFAPAPVQHALRSLVNKNTMLEWTLEYKQEKARRYTGKTLTAPLNQLKSWKKLHFIWAFLSRSLYSEAVMMVWEVNLVVFFLLRVFTHATTNAGKFSMKQTRSANTCFRFELVSSTRILKKSSKFKPQFFKSLMISFLLFSPTTPSDWRGIYRNVANNWSFYVGWRFIHCQ